MKKLILTLVMGVFAFGSSGFKANPIQTVDCGQIAQSVYENGMALGLPAHAANAMANYTYSQCVWQGGAGDSQDPVIVNG